MKHIILSLLLMASAFAKEGGHEGGGGGDPVAAQFSAFASYVAENLNSNPKLQPNADRKEINKLVKEIEDSLHVSSTVGKIEVVDATDRGLFIESTRSPLYIKMSRQIWGILTLDKKLKSITQLLVSLSTASDPDSIPLPANPVDAYADAYEACGDWVKLVETVFQLHINTINTCLRVSTPKLVAVLRDVDGQIRRNVEACKRACVYRKQVLTGGEVCSDYLDQHDQNIRDYKLLTPECM